MEYRTLKERSGISDFILEAICVDFLDKYDRFPYLDEIIGSNSEPYVRKTLQLDEHNSTNIDNILSTTGASTIEQANISLNDQYRDVEVEITPLNKDAIVEITKRPTEDNFDNWTEEDEILARAPRNEEGQLLAPNGKVSNLTEKQYAQVRTKAFKRWFGDWENDPENASKIVDENGEPLVVYHGGQANINIFLNANENNNHKGTKAANYFNSDRVGIYFSKYKYVGESYAKKYNKANRNLYEVFLNIKTPKIVKYSETFKNRLIRFASFGIVSRPDVANIKAEELNTEYQGFDGINHDNGAELIVFNSNQIKSATDNSGLFNRQNNNIYDPEPNGYLVFTNALNKLASLYGIKFNDVTDAELNSKKWKSIIPDVNSVNAFVYNGQIYINIDKANLDAPIHEMMHILVGSIRFQNPKLYTELISLAEQFPNYSKLIQKFPRRTRNDVNEEVFIEEVSRYLSGLSSNIADITPKLQYEISYNVKRLLDTILMGQDSVKTLTDDRLFSFSLKELAQQVNSSIMKNNFHGTINVENSELHRKLNNIKSDLYNQGTLKEYCD